MATRPSPTSTRCSHEINGTGRRRRAGRRLHRAEGRRLDGVRLLDLLRRPRRTASTRPRGASRRPSRSWVAPGLGLGVAGEPAAPVQPRLGRSRRQTVVRAQDVRLVGRGRTAEWTGHDVPDFIADRPPSYRPDEDATGSTPSPATTPFIMQADGRGLALRADGPPRRPAARRTTSRRSRRSTTRSTAQQRNPAARIMGTGRTTGTSRPVRPTRAFPVRDHHLPAHRASHRGRDERAGCPGSPSSSPSCSVRSRPSSPPSGASRTAAGRRSRRRAPRSRRGCW